MKPYQPTPEQRAAMERTKKPKLHPYRAWHGRSETDKCLDAEKVVPFNTRLVRA